MGRDFKVGDRVWVDVRGGSAAPANDAASPALVAGTVRPVAHRNHMHFMLVWLRLDCRKKPDWHMEERVTHFTALDLIADAVR